LQISELPTPCLLVDLDLLDSNIRKMAEFCRSRKCGLRPHAKAHKSPLVARKQLDAGAIGLCCQTLEEAEAMILNGVRPVLLTHMLASDTAILRFLNLRRHGDIATTVDGLENARVLANGALHRGLSVDVLVEVNVGHNRTGIEPREPAARLAAEITRLGGLRFRGIMGYEGHLQLSTPEFPKRKAAVHSALQGLTGTLDALERQGLQAEVVTAGGTGTYNITAEYPGVTDIQPGSYVTMDHRYNLIETAGSDFGNALTVLATVVSTPKPDEAVVDLGWKAASVEFAMFGWEGMPRPRLDGISYRVAGDEHGILKSDSPTHRPRVGDRIRFIPSHCDTTLNLHGKFYGVRGDEVELVCPIARR
jgi:D-serine deaminase-like pyridoxal phosphate-dependent protein